MHTKTLKNNAVTLLIGMVGASYVLADYTNDNPETLGTSALAGDTFVLTCLPGVTNARAMVWDRTDETPDNTQAQMRVTVINYYTGEADAAVDRTPSGTSGEGDPPSALTDDPIGASDDLTYDVLYEKTSNLVEKYRGKAICDPGGYAGVLVQQPPDQ